MSELTKEYFDQKLNEQTNELKAHAREQTEELARIVNSGFEGEHECLEGRFQEIIMSARRAG